MIDWNNYDEVEIDVMIQIAHTNEDGVISYR